MVMRLPIILLAFTLPLTLTAQSGGIKHYQLGTLGKAGPYSHAVEANGFLFLSGMIPMNYETLEADTISIGIATHRVFKNIREVLHYCGAVLDSTVKVTVYLRDMADFKEMNEAYAMWFPGEKPARSTVAVKELPLNMPIEIELTVWKGEDK
jgi:2-iminobutanoate/2-iminopropanoate deaminase